MTRSLMDSDPTRAGTRLRAQMLRLRPSTPVRVARAALMAAGSDAALVVDHDRPVGVITAETLAGADRLPPAPETPIGDILDLELVRVEPGADEATTLHAYADGAWRSLLRRRPFARRQDGR